jgi:hypothetical protein
MHPQTLRRTPRRPSCGCLRSEPGCASHPHPPLPLSPWLGKAHEVSAAAAPLLPGALTCRRASGGAPWQQDTSGRGCGSAWSRCVALADTLTCCKGGGGGFIIGPHLGPSGLNWVVKFDLVPVASLVIFFPLSFICFVRGFSDHFILDWPFGQISFEAICSNYENII